VAGLITLAAAALTAPAALADPPGNDDFGDSAPLSGASFTVSGTNVEATAQPGEPNHAGFSLRTGECFLVFDPSCQTSVWYSWTAPSTERVGLQTSGTDLDTTLAVYLGGSVGSLSEVASNDDAQPGGTTDSSVAFNAVAATTYRIAVAGFLADDGDFELATFDPPPLPIPPVVVPNPAAATTLAPAESSSQPAPKKKKHKHKKHKHKKGKNGKKKSGGVAAR